MRSGGAPPNSVTYNTLIDACVAHPELSLTHTYPYPYPSPHPSPHP